MDRVKVAVELVRLAKSLIAKDIRQITKELSEMADDLDAIDKTFSSGDYQQFWRDYFSAFKSTKVIQEFGSLGEAVENLLFVSEATLPGYEIDIAGLERDIALIRRVFDRWNVSDRAQNPGKYVNKERNFLKWNKRYLSQIPKKLRPVMIDNELRVNEAFGGGLEFLKQEHGSISPAFDDVEDLMKWGLRNTRKLSV